MTGRVVVTGGAGFVGSALVRGLVARGLAVTVVDTLVTGRRENLAGLPTDAVRLEIADIRDTAALMPHLKEADTVYHLACLGVRHSLVHPMDNHAVNATGSLGVVHAAMAAEVPRFVHVSSSEVYGTARMVPLSEEAPCFPHTVYGAAKLAGECYARAMFDTHGYPVVVVRPFNAYGPRCHHEGDCGEVVPRFLLQCLAGQRMTIFGDGEQTRDFTYVDELAEGIIEAGGCDSAVGETINLGQGMETTVNDLARVVAGVCGANKLQTDYQPARPGDVRRLFADRSRAGELFGWVPKIELADGVSRLRDWYEAQGISPHKLLEQVSVRSWETEAGTGIGAF